MLKVDQSPAEKKFVQNPYVFYREILKEGGVCFWKNYNQKAFFKYETINKIFKDKRFGRELPLGIEPTYDKEYPFYKFEEAGLTIEQIHKISAHLLETLTPEELAKAPGIGIAKARKVKEALQGKADKDGTIQVEIGSFSPTENMD